MATNYLSIEEFLAVTATTKIMRGGVEIRENLWSDVCTGTREALIQAEVYLGPFPGDAGQNKTTLQTNQDGYKRVKVRRYGRHRFVVEFELLAHVKARREALRDARVAHAEREKCMQGAQLEIDQLPKTAAAYRAHVAHWFDVMTKLLRSNSNRQFADGYGGYSFTPEAKAEIDAALDAVRAAMLRAEVFKSDRALAANIQEIKARRIRDDAATAFVQSLKTGAARE